MLTLEVFPPGMLTLEVFPPGMLTLEELWCSVWRATTERVELATDHKLIAESKVSYFDI